MFRRPDYVTDEDIQNWKFQAIEKVLAPLAKAWPDVLLLLAGTDRQRFDPARLGETLAADLSRGIDKLQREGWDRVREVEHNLREEKDKVIAQQKEQIKTLQNQNQILYKEKERLKKRVVECEGELNEQSDLITTLRTRLNSITGTGSH
jgi:predicted RNase H-like nuclease (RuvC/YqgF family)